jgi:hypothetical protein
MGRSSTTPRRLRASRLCSADTSRPLGSRVSGRSSDRATSPTRCRWASWRP